MAITIAARNTVNPMIARTLTSPCSCTTSGLSRAPPAAISVPPLVAMREHGLEERIVDGQQRALAVLHREQVDPEPAERQRHADVRQTDREAAIVMERRRDEPDQVVEADGDDEPRHPRQ